MSNLKEKWFGVLFKFRINSLVNKYIKTSEILKKNSLLETLFPKITLKSRG